jgi:hypothetical protein
MIITTQSSLAMKTIPQNQKNQKMTEQMEMEEEMEMEMNAVMTKVTIMNRAYSDKEER